MPAVIAGLRAECVCLVLGQPHRQVISYSILELCNTEHPCITKRQTHVVITGKAPGLQQKNLQRWEVELCFRDSINNPPILCLLLGSFGVSINFFCNSCIRYVSLPQVYRVVVLCFSPQHSVDTPGGVKLH